MVLTISFVRGHCRVCYLKYYFVFNGISYAADFRSTTFVVGHCLIEAIVSLRGSRRNNLVPRVFSYPSLRSERWVEREPGDEAGVERRRGRGGKGNRSL